MDKRIEEIFIRNIVKKEKADRVCYELNRTDKRSYALHRFAWLKLILNFNNMTDITQVDAESFYKKVCREYECCYIIIDPEESKEIDGVWHDLTIDLIKTCFSEEDPVIMIFDKNHGVIKGEYEKGPAQKVWFSMKDK